jgi:hypothetical protein
MDEEAFWALLEAPGDGADLGSCVSALVQSVAMTLAEPVTR